MQTQFTAPTAYFLQEGRDNLRNCLQIAFASAKQQNVSKIVIFTAHGEGVRIALESFCSQAEYSHIKFVAVSFANGKIFTDKEGERIEVKFSPEDLEFFKANSVPVVRAHLPFDPITPFHKGHGMLGQGLSLVSEALGVLGGSMALCVQAITMACDAGEVEIGEHVIALTSDTAVLAQASNTDRMLGELIVREILCKAAVLTISRKEHSEKMPGQLSFEMEPEPKNLPSPIEITGVKPDSKPKEK
jgi:hypothetical protein